MRNVQTPYELSVNVLRELPLVQREAGAHAVLVAREEGELLLDLEQLLVEDVPLRELLGAADQVARCRLESGHRHDDLRGDAGVPERGDR